LGDRCSRREEQVGECGISSEMWQREFGKTPSCRKSSDLRHKKSRRLFDMREGVTLITVEEYM
jgi:hypothetical protein